MPLSNRWPHAPTKLSDLIDVETLSVLISGCCTRLGRAMTILDYDQATGRISRVDPLSKQQNFDPFCATLRDPNLVDGGESACERCDMARASATIKQWKERGEIGQFAYRCHMGLFDASQLVFVEKTPVGVLLAGQFGSRGERKEVRNRIEAIAKNKVNEMRFIDPFAESRLTQAMHTLQIQPTDFAEQVQREVNLIQKVATDDYQRQKADKERDFLNLLRTARTFEKSTSLQQICQQIEHLLALVCDYCGCEYIVFFAAVGEKDTVLMPVAQSRTAQAQSDPQTQPLPHFNWSKAGLEDQQGGETHRLIGRGDVALERGIRGENAKLFANASCAVTSKLGKSYRVVMLFGPFGELQNALEEKVFLTQVCRVISWAFYFQLQALRLRDEQTHLETTKMLLQHRFRTALMPLAAHIGFAKQQLDRRLLDTTLKPMLERVKAAHELSLQLGRATRETVRSTDVMVERDDLRIDTYPLSVLAANCVNGFMEKASQEGRELILDASIENLPYAEIDIARMTIALSNLVDNALKYSFPGTKIYVRSLLPGISSVDLEHSVIAIQDIGEAVPNDKLESIFEKGERGLVEAKMGKIPGMGYGLWEARAILDAHGGSISVKSEETSMHYRQGYAHRVTFTVKIPLKQG